MYYLICSKNLFNIKKRLDRVEELSQKIDNFDWRLKQSMVHSDVDQMLRRKEVVQITGMSHSTIHRRMNAGEFPKAKVIGPNAVRWLKSEVEEWMHNKKTNEGQPRRGRPRK